MAMTTGYKILRILHEGMEPTEPAESILTYLRSREGKTLTKRDLPALQKIDPTIGMDNRAGMAHVSWGRYNQTDGNSGGSMLLAYTEGAPVVNSSFVEEHNACYFSARVRRNAAREAALTEQVAVMIAGRLVDEIRARQKELDALLAYEGPLYVEKYAIEKLLKES